MIPGGPADGKLQLGDKLIELAGGAVDDLDTVRRKLISAEPEKEIQVVVLRDGNRKKISVVPGDIAGPAPAKTIELWTQSDKPDGDDAKEDNDNKWKVSELKLPDVPNVAAVLAPSKPGNTDAANRLGLLVVLTAPGQGAPEEILKPWTDVAARSGVVVCVVAPAEENRWRPQEIDVVTRMASSVLQRHPIASRGRRRRNVRRIGGRGCLRSRCDGLGRGHFVQPDLFRCSDFSQDPAAGSKAA